MDHQTTDKKEAIRTKIQWLIILLVIIALLVYYNTDIDDYIITATACIIAGIYSLLTGQALIYRFIWDAIVLNGWGGRIVGITLIIIGFSIINTFPT